MKKSFLYILTLFLFVLVGCGGEAAVPETEVEPTPVEAPESDGATAVAEPTTLTLMSHDSFNISEEILATFEEEHNVQIELLPPATPARR